MDQFVRRQCWVPKPVRLLGADHGQLRGIKEAELHEERGLVPVDVLMGNFAVDDAHHHHMWQGNLAAGWRNAGQ